MTTTDNGRGCAAVDPSALAWNILHRCKQNEAASWPDHVHPHDDRFSVRWDPMSMGYGNLGTALVFSAADELDPDAGWDQAAHRHIAAAVERYRVVPGLGVGLFSGTAGLAFVLRALSRGGTRYRGAITDVDHELLVRARTLLAGIDPDEGVAVEQYDVISGLAGLATYVMTTRAHEVPTMADLFERVIETLSTLALATGDIGGFWTPRGKVTELDRASYAGLWAGFLNLGFAHGIAGVVSVLGQACDRGLGGSRTRDAVEVLAEIIGSSAGTMTVVDVPYHLGLAPYRAAGVTRSARSNPELSRFAWCYGNPGVALALSNSETLSSAHRVLIANLMDRDRRPGDQLNIDNPSLCHGYAGLMLIEKWTATGDGDAAREQVLSMMDPDMRLLLRNPQLGIDHIDSPGFLDGAGGAAIALLEDHTGHESACLRAISGRWL